MTPAIQYEKERIFPTYRAWLISDPSMWIRANTPEEAIGKLALRGDIARVQPKPEPTMPKPAITPEFRELVRVNPNLIVDNINKMLAEPDEPTTVREEWTMACPECNDDEQIDVLASVWARLTPDGCDASASHDGEHAWSSVSAVKCGACGHTGIAREFTIKGGDE